MNVYIDLSSFLNDMSGPVPPNIFSSYLKPFLGEHKSSRFFRSVRPDVFI